MGCDAPSAGTGRAVRLVASHCRSRASARSASRPRSPPPSPMVRPEQMNGRRSPRAARTPWRRAFAMVRPSSKRCSTADRMLVDAKGIVSSPRSENRPCRRHLDPVTMVGNLVERSRVMPRTGALSKSRRGRRKPWARYTREPPASGIFDVATTCSTAQSIRSVGVEQSSGADVSKSASTEACRRDDLIVAYLDSRNARFWDKIDRLLAKENDRRTRVLRVSDRLRRAALDQSRHPGCPLSSTRRRSRVSRRAIGSSKRTCTRCVGAGSHSPRMARTQSHGTWSMRSSC